MGRIINPAFRSPAVANPSAQPVARGPIQPGIARPGQPAAGQIAPAQGRVVAPDQFNRNGLGVHAPQVSALANQAQLQAAQLQKAPARGLSNESAAGASASGRVAQANVDFSQLSQAEQYNYLQKMTIDRAGGDPSAWKSGDREVNMVGIRSFNASGQGHLAKNNQYDDTIYVARMVDGKPRVDAFQASVDPGKQSDGHDASRLADGFIKDAWSRGTVSGGEAGLRQNRAVPVYSDANGNGTIDVGQEDQSVSMLSAANQLQFHRGGAGEVGDASAGCQVIKGYQYDKFQKILAEAPQSQQKFSYLMADVNEMPQIDQHNQAFDSESMALPVGLEDAAAANGTDGGIGRVIQPSFIYSSFKK